MPDAPTPDATISDWIARGRLLLNQIEEQIATHQELADNYRLHARRISDMLGSNGVQEPNL